MLKNMLFPPPKDFYQKKLHDNMQNQIELDHRDFNEAIYLMKTDEEIEFVRNALVYYQEMLFKKRLNANKDFLAVNFFSVLFMLKKTKKVMEIYNDKVCNFLF